MGLNNQTPAQVARINLPLGQNKWLDLIVISARYKKFNQNLTSDENVSNLTRCYICGKLRFYCAQIKFNNKVRIANYNKYKYIVCKRCKPRFNKLRDKFFDEYYGKNYELVKAKRKKYERMRGKLFPKVLFRYKNKCFYCKKQFKDSDIIQIHHIKELEQGGSNRLSNLAPIHLRCHDKIHSRKGTLIALYNTYKMQQKAVGKQLPKCTSRICYVLINMKSRQCTRIASEIV